MSTGNSREKLNATVSAIHPAVSMHNGSLLRSDEMRDDQAVSSSTDLQSVYCRTAASSGAADSVTLKKVYVEKPK